MRPRAHIITIGNEILRGSVLNTNGNFLGCELTSFGFEVVEQGSCQDTFPAIKEKLQNASMQADLLIMTGGLGPTPDDMTRDAVAEFYGEPLVESKRQLSFIRNHFKKRKKKMPAIVYREALFPKNSIPLFNHHGIALGFYVKNQGPLVVVLPGVPREMVRMYKDLVKPLLKRHFKQMPKRYPLIVKTIGLSEPKIMKLLKKDFFDDEFDFGIYPSLGETTLRIYCLSTVVRNRLKAKIQKRLGKDVYAYEETSIAAVVGALLKKKKKTLSVAESCTGGSLAAEITRVPGASRYFKGSVTAYANPVKALLGVSQKDLREKGAVSRPVAVSLAKGIRQKMKTSFGLSTTGVAGPAGGSLFKPAGLVYLAIASEKKLWVYEEQFSGDREQVQIRAVKKILESLWRALKS